MRFVCFSGNDFFELLILNKLHIPPSGPLFTNDTDNFPFVFVGDEAFSLSEKLMRPYAGYNPLRKTDIQLTFMSGTKIVECTFGILSNKWRFLNTALNVSKGFSKNIIKARVLLHNLVRSKDGYGSEAIGTVLTVLHVAVQDDVHVM